MAKYDYLNQRYILSEDELAHWKYIKREKKNGKWVYYYDDKSNKLSNLQRAAKTKDQKFESQFNKMYDNRYHNDLADATSEQGRENVESWYADKGIREGTKRTYGDSGRYGVGHTYKVDADRAHNKVSAHEKTVGGKVDSFMQKNGTDIAKTANTVSNAVSKVGDTTKKAANEVSNTAKKTIKTVSDFASSSAAKGKSYLENLFNKNKNQSTTVLTSANGKKQITYPTNSNKVKVSENEVTKHLGTNYKETTWDNVKTSTWDNATKKKNK